MNLELVCKNKFLKLFGLLLKVVIYSIVSISM